MCQRSSNHKLKAIHNWVASVIPQYFGVSKIVKSQIESNSQRDINLHVLRFLVCQRSSNHKLKAIHNCKRSGEERACGVSKIVKSQIESNSQRSVTHAMSAAGCVKDRQITNWKQFTTGLKLPLASKPVCQRSSNHKLKAIHNMSAILLGSFIGVSKIVKSQIESNSQPGQRCISWGVWCVKDRQITNWKQFTTTLNATNPQVTVCQRSSNHKLKAIHNCD